jgi:hypothetical protein
VGLVKVGKKKQQTTKGATIDLSYNVPKVMGVTKHMILYNYNSSMFGFHHCKTV